MCLDIQYNNFTLLYFFKEMESIVPDMHPVFSEGGNYQLCNVGRQGIKDFKEASVFG